MANESSEKIEDKRSKDAEKPNDRSKSFLGRFGSTLKAYLRTLSWFRELSTNSDVNGNEEEVRPQEITTGMKSLLEWFGRTLIDFLTPSWYPESPLPSSDADPNDNEEEEEQQGSFLEWFGWKLKDFLTPSWFRESSSHSTNENMEEEEPQQTMMGVKTLLGELGSTLKDFLTTSFARDSSRRSTNADIQSNGCKEDEITVETTTTTTTTVVEVLQTDDAGTGDGPRIQKLCSELVEISVKATREDIKVESLLEEFGSTLKDFLTTPFVRAISEQSTNADPNDYTVEKKRPELNTVEEVLPAAVAVTGDGPGIEEGPSSNLTDFSVKATTEGIKVELDFFDLLLFARSFSAKTSEAASHPCSVTGGFQHGYVLAPQLFNLCNTPHNLLRKTPTADHYLYLDDLQLFIEFSPTLTPDSIDHLRVVTQYCSW